MNIISSIVCLAVVSRATQVDHGEIVRQYCRSNLWRSDEAPFSYKLTINCSCGDSPGADVSADIVDLINYPEAMSSDNGQSLEEMDISLTKCSLENEVFPVSALEILRRSRKIRIDIRHCPKIRLGTMHNANVWRSYVKATFYNSTMGSLGPGWLDQTSYLSLKVRNCIIDVIETNFTGRNSGRSESSSILFDTATIHNIQENAFQLPQNSTLVFKTCIIEQWSNKGFNGGGTLRISASKITNIQSFAFQTQYLEHFVLEDSIIGSVSAYALFQSTFPIQKSFDTTVIRSNKFMKTDRKAFYVANLRSHVMIEHNLFKGSNIVPLEFDAGLNLESRDTQTGIFKHNLVDCETCLNVIENQLMQQACDSYRTTFCLCKSQDQLSLTQKKPCYYSLYHHIQTNCPQNYTTINTCNIPSDLDVKSFGNNSQTTSNDVISVRNFESLSSILFVIGVLSTLSLSYF